MIDKLVCINMTGRGGHLDSQKECGVVSQILYVFTIFNIVLLHFQDL